VKQYPEKPIRLVDLPCEQDPSKVGLFIRSATTVPSEDTPAVKWRIRNTLHQRRQRRSRGLRFVLAFAIIFVAGGVAGAMVLPLLRTRPLALSFSHAEPDTVASAGHGSHRELRPQPAPPEQTATQVATAQVEDSAPIARPPSTSVPPGKTAKAQVAPRRVAAIRRAEPSGLYAEPLPAFPVQPGPPAAPARLMPASSAAAVVPVSAAAPGEHALIATALHRLRTSHEPQAALAALDDYRHRFPSGELAPEANRLRAEALLLLGRKTTLLEELDRSPLGETASDEWVVLRGELRAAAGRWQAALADFDAVVRTHPIDSGSGAETNDQRARAHMERALWGRASARSHVGDDAGARADLCEYLRRFPNGRFADQTSRLLDKGR